MFTPRSRSVSRHLLTGGANLHDENESAELNPVLSLDIWRTFVQSREGKRYRLRADEVAPFAV
jgi:hypothetical protein